MNFDKLRIIGLKPEDDQIMLDAVLSYKDALQYHLEVEHKSSQYIHVSILNVLKYDLFKRVNNRTKSKKPVNISLELHTAFLLYDALSFYSTQCNDHYQSAKLGRVMIAIHQELPRATDAKILTVGSTLNFNE